MEDTKILCPDCMKGTIKTETADTKKGACSHCGTKFLITGPKSVRYE